MFVFKKVSETYKNSFISNNFEWEIYISKGGERIDNCKLCKVIVLRECSGANRDQILAVENSNFTCKH
jgi:hypothetical protein